jgi:tripartite-type tricarboxylate transporter receptor subunit TctC
MLKFMIPLAAAVSLACTVSAQSQSNTAGFPKAGKPIQLIVPNSAGGGTDIAARLLAEGLEAKLGTTVVVQNISGAGGIEGANRLIRAEPDGHTIALVPLPQVNMYYLDPERGGKFTAADIVPIAMHDYGPLALAVSAKSSYQTLGDIVQAAKKSPGTLTSASSAVLATGHLSLLRLNKVADISLNWTAMEKQGTAMSSLLGGHLDLITDTLSELYPSKKNGDTRILAVFAEERQPGYPEIPTAREQGFDVVVTTSRLVIAPKGTPAEAVKVVQDAVQALISDPAYKEKAAQRQVQLRFLDAQQAAATWKQIDQNFGPIVAEFRGKKS